METIGSLRVVQVCFVWLICLGGASGFRVSGGLVALQSFHKFSILAYFFSLIEFFGDCVQDFASGLVGI